VRQEKPRILKDVGKSSRDEQRGAGAISLLQKLKLTHLEENQPTLGRHDDARAVTLHSTLGDQEVSHHLCWRKKKRNYTCPMQDHNNFPVRGKAMTMTPEKKNFPREAV